MTCLFINLSPTGPWLTEAGEHARVAADMSLDALIAHGGAGDDGGGNLELHVSTASAMVGRCRLDLFNF